MSDHDDALALSREIRRLGKPVALATSVDGAAAAIGSSMAVTVDRVVGSILAGSIDDAVEREARAALDDGEARILTFKGRPTTTVFVEPVAHADLLERLAEAVADGVTTAEVIDLTTGLHTLVLADGVVHGRFGLTEDTAAVVAECRRTGRHRLIDEGEDGRRLFIRVTTGERVVLRG